MKKLDDLRLEVNVPKGQWNSFGNYAYRSQEDILEGVKPYLKKYGLSLQITDNLVQVGERYYVEATVKVSDSDSGEFVTSVAYAREPQSKKGMDESQITGTASSYARKYALNAMFLLDDTKDADTDEHHREAERKPQGKSKKEEKPFDAKEAREKIENLMQEKGLTIEYREEIKKKMNNAKTREDYLVIFKEVKGE